MRTAAAADSLVDSTWRAFVAFYFGLPLGSKAVFVIGALAFALFVWIVVRILLLFSGKGKGKK